ncbi:MAG: M23 family metallopeptidase [Thermomicrobiales bacterium]
MSRWSLLIFVAILVAITPWRTATAQSTPVAPPLSRPQPTALLVFTAQDPMWVPASDGKVHIVYDLVMTNIFSSPVTITSVEILTTDGVPLLHLAGDALLAATRPVFGDTPTQVVPTSGAIVTLVNVPLSADAVPERLTHRVTYALQPHAPAATLLASRVVEGPEAILVDREPQIIAPPLLGGSWVNINGCCAASPHRSLRLVVDGSQIKTIQMFAIDWVKIEDGATFAGDGARNEDHHAFGQDLLAVADGRVVVIQDDLVDNVPFQTRALQDSIDLFGNQIVLEIAPGVYAIYAHVQQGSALVQVGDLVHAGDTLGRLGNSGNSGSPHLHFQLADGSDIMTSTSLPFVIDAWTREGSLLPDSSLTSVQVRGPSSLQADTLPLELTVADFGG